MSEPIHIISLGAGVQSSTMALMAAKGELTPMPKCAIFADTQAEPSEVYEYLNYLAPLLPFPCYIVTAGNLEEDFLRALQNPKGRCGQPPFYVWNEDKQVEATLWRKCTKEYKLDPIRKEVRRVAAKEIRDWKQYERTMAFALKPYIPVHQWIGISLDEAHRMKSSGVKYIQNCYPLVEKRMSRHDCLVWLKRNSFNEPPKSACRFCPYINNSRLRRMRDTQPEDWRRLVAFDHRIREFQKATISGARITGTIYVHRSCKPIDKVDLSTEEDNGQINLFGNECEGMCGV